MMAASMAVLRNELRVLRTEYLGHLLPAIMPIPVMAFMKSAFRPVLVEEGFEGASGAEQTVPGMAVLFTFFLIGTAGFSYFREHGWRTWDRLRASHARSIDIIIGKSIPPVALAMAQLCALLGVGVLALDLNIAGPPAPLALLLLALSICIVAIGVAATAVCKHAQQLNVISSVGTMVMGGLGGAFVPVSTMPGWSQPIAPLTPSYWAMRGMNSVILAGEGLGAVLLPTAVLLAMAAGFAALAAWRFRFDEAKANFA